MEAVEIKKGIYWVGGIDWDLRDFHGYSTKRGSTYNAYLIIDEKVTLVDTVKHYLYDEMVERIETIIDPSKIDYVVANHVEMDHSGCIPMLINDFTNATVITSPNGEKGLKEHYGEGWDFKVVNSGDSISIGERTLQFVHVPMVHWPDSMVTYVSEEKLLLPNDAFGQHIASVERFDDEISWEIVKEEAAKYYANIVLPFGAQVQKALEALKDLEIDMIAPSHGLIWRSHIIEALELYDKWSRNETEEKALVIYDTMWDSTKKIAEAIYEGFMQSGITAELMNLRSNHISDIMTDMLTAKYICVGSSTLNNNMLPTVAAFTTYMKGLAPKNRVALAFGSYGWGGQSVSQLDEILKGCGFDVIDPVKIKFVPKDEELRAITGKIEKEIKKRRQIGHES